MIYVTSDHHFDHWASEDRNIIKYCERPFASIDEMNRELIKRWNSVVSKRDVVYHLGDFTLGGFPTFFKYFSQLNGLISLVPGGHDDRWINDMKKPDCYMPQNMRILPPLLTIKYQKKKITLCHYPMRSWEGSHHGSLHLHGHCHGTIGVKEESGDQQIPPGEKRGMRLDVSVDCWDFYPIPFEKVLRELS